MPFSDCSTTSMPLARSWRLAWHADAEIDVKTVAQFLGDAAGDAFAFLFVG